MWNKVEHALKDSQKLAELSLCEYLLRMHLKGLKVKVENHTKIANSENEQKSKMPSFMSPLLGGIKGKMSETWSLLLLNIQ